MTTLYNDPAEFAEDQLAGFVDLYADRLQAVPGGVISHRAADPIVAVVVGVAPATTRRSPDWSAPDLLAVPSSAISLPRRPQLRFTR